MSAKTSRGLDPICPCTDGTARAEGVGSRAHACPAPSGQSTKVPLWTHAGQGEEVVQHRAQRRQVGGPCHAVAHWAAHRWHLCRIDPHFSAGSGRGQPGGAGCFVLAQRRRGGAGGRTRDAGAAAPTAWMNSVACASLPCPPLQSSLCAPQGAYPSVWSHDLPLTSLTGQLLGTRPTNSVPLTCLLPRHGSLQTGSSDRWPGGAVGGQAAKARHCVRVRAITPDASAAHAAGKWAAMSQQDSRRILPSPHLEVNENSASSPSLTHIEVKPATTHVPGAGRADAWLSRPALSSARQRGLARRSMPTTVVALRFEGTPGPDAGRQSRPPARPPPEADRRCAPTHAAPATACCSAALACTRRAGHGTQHRGCWSAHAGSEVACIAAVLTCVHRAGHVVHVHRKPWAPLLALCRKVGARPLGVAQVLVLVEPAPRAGNKGGQQQVLGSAAGTFRAVPACARGELACGQPGQTAELEGNKYGVWCPAFCHCMGSRAAAPCSCPCQSFRRLRRLGRWRRQPPLPVR